MNELWVNPTSSQAATGLVAFAVLAGPRSSDHNVKLRSDGGQTRPAWCGLRASTAQGNIDPRL
jgi:hypothetical protein